MDLPIFTLTWGFDIKSEKFGLLFMDELKNDSQDFSFYIPVPVQFNNGRSSFKNWEDEIYDHNYYFPFESDGENILLQGELKYPELSFGVPGIGETIRFQIDIFSIRSFYRTQDIKTGYLHQYVGSYKRDPILERLIFIPILPRNIHLMNRIFLQKKGIFLGYSPLLGLPIKL
jgi:hypothetical protein